MNTRKLFINTLRAREMLQKKESTSLLLNLVESQTKHLV